MPSRVVNAPTAAHKTIVSPYRITQDPSACLATRPTSTLSSRSPTRIDSFRYFFTVIFVRLLLTTPTAGAGTQRLVRYGWVELYGMRRWSPLLKALTSQRTPKKQKAAEPGSEALAAFSFVRPYASP